MIGMSKEPSLVEVVKVKKIVLEIKLNYTFPFNVYLYFLIVELRQKN